MSRPRVSKSSSVSLVIRSETKKDRKEYAIDLEKSIKNIFHEIIGQNKNVISLYEVVSEHFGLH